MFPTRGVGLSLHLLLFLYCFFLLMISSSIFGCNDVILNKYGDYIFINTTQPGPVNCSWLIYRRSSYKLLEIRIKNFVAFDNQSTLELHERSNKTDRTIFNLTGNYTHGNKEAVFTTLEDDFYINLTAPGGFTNLSFSYLSYNMPQKGGLCPVVIPDNPDYKCHTLEMCIHFNLTCDGVSHCPDHTDETYACGLAHEGSFGPLISRGLIVAIFFLVLAVIALFIYLSLHYFWKIRLFQHPGHDTIRMTQSSADMGRGPDRPLSKAATAEAQIHDAGQPLDYGATFHEYQPHHRPSHQPPSDTAYEESAYTVYI